MFQTDEPGCYKLCQLCVGLPGLEFLSDCIKPRLKYEVVDMPITTRLIKGEKDLLAGLPQTLVVNIHTGSKHIAHVSEMGLHINIMGKVTLQTWNKSGNMCHFCADITHMPLYV